MDDSEKLTWVFLAVAFLMGMSYAGWMLGGVRRRRGRKPLPADWWICESCTSVNEPDRATCYHCGRPPTPDARRLPTAPEFHIDQRFGSQKHHPGYMPGELERSGGLLPRSTGAEGGPIPEAVPLPGDREEPGEPLVRGGDEREPE